MIPVFSNYLNSIQYDTDQETKFEFMTFFVDAHKRKNNIWYLVSEINKEALKRLKKPLNIIEYFNVFFYLFQCDEFEYDVEQILENILYT